MNNRIRWGVHSTAKIGREKVIPAMQKCNKSTVVAITSENPEHAKKQQVCWKLKRHMVRTTNC